MFARSHNAKSRVVISEHITTPRILCALQVGVSQQSRAEAVSCDESRYLGQSHEIPPAEETRDIFIIAILAITRAG